MKAGSAIPRHWKDSILHFEEVLHLNPDNREAAENRAYVKKRLEKWLDGQEHADTDPSADQPNPDQDPPEQKPEQSPEKNPARNPDSTPENNNTTTPDNPPSTTPDKPDKNNPGDEESRPPASDSIKPRPGESTEEFARRILRDNADFEMRLLPLKPLGGQRSKKDW